jgi:ABC-type sugar transport system substrate-binding protein
LRAVEGTDPPSVAPVLKKARLRGIKVITWDYDESRDSRDFFISQVRDRDFGYALVDAMARALAGEKPEGKVAVETTSEYGTRNTEHGIRNTEYGTPVLNSREEPREKGDCRAKCPKR